MSSAMHFRLQARLTTLSSVPMVQKERVSVSLVFNIFTLSPSARPWVPKGQFLSKLWHSRFNYCSFIIFISIILCIYICIYILLYLIISNWFSQYSIEGMATSMTHLQSLTSTTGAARLPRHRHWFHRGRCRLKPTPLDPFSTCCDL